MAYLFETIGAFVSIITVGMGMMEFFARRGTKRLEVRAVARAFVNAAGNTAIFLEIENKSPVELVLEGVSVEHAARKVRYGIFHNGMTMVEVFKITQTNGTGTNENQKFEKRGISTNDMVSGYISLPGKSEKSSVSIKLRTCDTGRRFSRTVIPFFESDVVGTAYIGEGTINLVREPTLMAQAFSNDTSSDS